MIERVPRIVYSPVFCRWYVLTKYRKQAGVDAVTGEKKSYLRALEKHDITDQMLSILREVERRALARKRKRGTSRPAGGK